MQLLSEVKPSLVKPGEVHYRLTADMIRQIFAENVVARRAYDDNVPHKKSEEEFWKEYLQSKYVEAVGNKVKHTVVGDIFAKAEAEMDEEKKDDVRQKRIEIDVDIRPGEGEEGEKFVDAEEPAKLQPVGLSANANSVIDKFNAHSALVVSNATSTTRLEENEDLQPDPKRTLLRLNLNEVVSASEEEVVDQKADIYQVSRSEIVEFKKAFKGGVKKKEFEAFWSCESCYKLPTAVEERKEERVVVSDSATQNKVNELLRHYWGCYPLTSPQALSKAKRMRDSISQLQVKDSDAFGPAIQRALQHAKQNIPNSK